jgi:hypothetical protein
MAGLPTALTTLMILRFLSRNGWTLPGATLGALGYGLGSMAFPWATTFFGHQLAAFFSFGAFYLVWTTRACSAESRRPRLLLAGWMLGFLPVIEYPGAIASGLIAVYAGVVLGGRALAFLFAGALVGALPLPVYNMAALGSPGVLSYSFYKEGSTFPAHQQGIMGVAWPRLEVLNEITLRPQRGLFHANPWLLLGLFAPFFLRTRRDLRAETRLAIAVFAAGLLFNSGFGDSIVYWGGAFSFGPRHLLFTLPFAAVLAATALTSRVLAPLAAVLIAGTSLLMLTVAAIDPRLPYEPAEPFLGFYLPLYSRGLHSVYPWATFGESVLFQSPGAFNLGRALSLPLGMEVLPLALVWAAAVFALFRDLDAMGRLARVVTATLAVLMGLWPGFSRNPYLATREPGLCQTVSRNHKWPYLSDYALQAEPSGTPTTQRVRGPVVAAARETESPAQIIAMTFSGYFEAREPGWHVIRMEAIGQAALYINGFRRLKVGEPGNGERAEMAQVYLSSGPHELIVRYMSDQPVRSLGVTIGFKDEPLVPLEAGLSSNACPN